jgi:hypothetical protein
MRGSATSVRACDHAVQASRDDAMFRRARLSQRACLVLVVCLLLGGCGGGGGAGAGPAGGGTPVAVMQQATAFVSAAPAVAAPAAAATLASGTQVLLLQVASGTRASGAGERVCESASGDELCAVQADVEATGGVRIIAFVPEQGADIVWQQQGERLSVNRVDADSRGVSGVLRLGQLTLDVQGAGALSLDTTSVAVGAGADLRPVVAPSGPSNGVLARAN